MNAIRNLDLSLIETATEQASSRLDHSAVIAATVGGALAGALAAIIVSLF
jgi:hypothetical protein